MNIIYGIYRRSGELVYVGQSKNFEQRKAAHLSGPNTKLRKWMTENGDTEVEFRILAMYEDEAMAKGVEAGIINAIRPPMNVYCSGEFFRSKYITHAKRGHSKLREPDPTTLFPQER